VRRKRLYLVPALLGLILSGPAARTASDTGSPAPAAPRGQMVDVGGFRLYLHCAGKGRPTVVLLIGMGGAAAEWSQVQAGVARFTRVCSYDRAGEGLSEPSPANASLQQTVTELHRLLLRARVREPYVLVGQSWGGPIARVYAHQYPEHVAGMVLVDSTHEDTTLNISGKTVQPRLQPAGSPLKADMDRLHDTRENRDHPLGDLPLIVLTAGRTPAAPPGAPAEEWAKLQAAKRPLQADLARLSRNSRHVIAEKSGHAIHRDEPELVIRSIREVVEAVRRGGRLSSAGSSASSD
jgi:pimeloyl-ACP methyl ester carboxylesterase